MESRGIIGVVCVAVCFWSAVADDPVPGGITGIVYVRGAAPDTAWIPLAEAAVIVEPSHGDTSLAPVSGSLVVDENGLHPLIQTMAPRGVLRIASRSSSIHRLYAVAPDGAHLFTVALTVPGVEIHKIVRGEGLVTIRCAEPRHSHEVAHLYVNPHAGSAVTDEAGRFLIQGVAPGVRAIVALHPQIGSVMDSLMVVPARAAERSLFLIRLDLPPAESSSDRP